MRRAPFTPAAHSHSIENCASYVVMYHPTPSAATRPTLKSPARAPPSSLYFSPPPAPLACSRLTLPLQLMSPLPVMVALYTPRISHLLQKYLPFDAHIASPEIILLLLLHAFFAFQMFSWSLDTIKGAHLRTRFMFAPCILPPPPSPPSRSSACASNRTLFCAKPLLIFCEERRGTSWSAPQSCCSKTRAKTRPRPTRHSGRL